MNELAITEYNSVRVLTTQQLADSYGTDVKTISYNFNHNKDRYVEGKHYICLVGDELRAFREIHDLPFNLNKLYLWTEKGTFLHAKSLNTDIAWEVYDRLTETYFKIRENQIAISELSPQLQLMNMLVENMNRAELEQKRQAEQIARVETAVTTIKEILTQPIGDWKSDINSRVREISIKSGIDYQTLYSQLYGELETTANCSLKRLCENKKSRMEKVGNTKTAIKNETTKIAVIYDKPQLKAIFEGIVKKYAMKYCA